MFNLEGSFRCYFNSTNAMIKTIIVLGGMSSFFAVLLYKVYSFDFWENGVREHNKTSKVNTFIFDKHPWGIPFVLLIVCWLPYIVYLFPGTISWDGLEALCGAFRYMTWTNHHPAISSWLMKIAISAGRKIGNETYGFFLYNIIQIILQAAVFAEVFSLLKRKNVCYLIRWITLIWYAFFTVWPTNGYAMNKDTMYYIMFTLYILLTINFIDRYKQNQVTWKNILIYIIGMILLCIFRNNGIYVVLLTIPCLLIATGRKHWKVIVILLFSMLLYNIAYNHVFLPMMNIKPGSEREMFSVPFQQTARYVKEHSEEITTEEAEAIRGILDFDHLAELYNPEISDAVKWTYKDKADNSAKLAYIKTWIKQFIKHPLTYFEATFNNTYRYFDPLQEEYSGGTGGAYEISGPDFYRENFTFSQNTIFATERKGLQKAAETIKGIPIIGIIYGTGIYTWILLVLTGGIVAERQYDKFVILIPLLLSLLICIVSPVNGCMRYMLPIMSTLPLTIGIVSGKEKSEQSKE